MSKPVILLLGKIHPRVVERLQDGFHLLRTPPGQPVVLSEDEASSVRGIAVAGVVPGALIDSLPNLEIIANFGVGYDGVDVAAASRRNVIVTNTPDVLDDEVADTTIALLLNTLRRFHSAETYLREGRWEKEGPFALSPLSLRGRHVGLYGLGRIGGEIASRLRPFKVKIGYHTRSQKSGVDYDYYPTLEALAEAVDTLICIVPKTAETHKAINADILKRLGPEGVLINVGRGWSVDEDDLMAALKAGTIAAAGLDVFYEEPKVPAGFFDLPNVSLLPHVASASVVTRNAMADLVVDNLIGWFESGTVKTPVPETPVAKK
ncbi:2-hydroxyacid dehydrogenase [Allorhizobium sp. BGMRC 0089]|uniref:2-hydroxyacid dehydrogenase n=1 Tax=Allorhizobium sonneratiae TaxID=2934936 RepID=UPI0020338935|nr:2-hydroxyacid dehydrogenase [Allorhizobium sonneratiae]MCM2292454.1 2-hydroxyacid dehydrogenase [Allorhizobium sonneratiae]